MSLALATRPVTQAAVFRMLPRANACETCPGRRGLCASVKPDEIGRLNALRSLSKVAPGVTFIDEGDPALHVFTVTSGTVKLFKSLPDGRRQIIGFLVPGDIFGFVPGGVHTASAEAVDAVTLCRFPRRRLEQIFMEFPGMERQLLDLVAQELAVAQQQMVLLGRKTAPERLASFLLALAQRQGKDDQAELPMTRTDIADYLGLTMETVSRVFTVLKNTGSIACPSTGKVRILDPEALADLAEGLAQDDA